VGRLLVGSSSHEEAMPNVYKTTPDMQKGKESDEPERGPLSLYSFPNHPRMTEWKSDLYSVNRESCDDGAFRSVAGSEQDRDGISAGHD
jgi:hypothetical protein